MIFHYLKLGAFLSTVLFVVSCGNAGHNHAEEGHDHESEAHDEHEGEHKEASSDEIVISAEKAKAAGIVSIALQPADFSEVIEVSGKIGSAQGSEATVVASADGVVSLNHAMAEGVAVNRGAALMTINAQTLSTGDPVQRASIAYEAAKKEYERAEQLVKSRIISEKDFNAIREKYDEARLNYGSLSKHYKSGRQVVTAALDGYILQCFVKDGDFVTMGQPLALVAQNRRLSLKADVPEKYYAALPSIHSANIKLPSGELVELSQLNGRLLSYGRTAGDSYYIPMTFEFDNKGKMLSGSFVEVYLLGTKTPNTLAVPVSSIIEEQGLYFVFIQLDEDCYRKQEVALGRNDGLRTEILSGLKKGDKVVVKGAYQVKLAGASNAIPAHTHAH